MDKESALIWESYVETLEEGSSNQSKGLRPLSGRLLAIKPQIQMLRRWALRAKMDIKSIYALETAIGEYLVELVTDKKDFNAAIQQIEDEFRQWEQLINSGNPLNLTLDQMGHKYQLR